jgi:plasmid stabilization system protein ParE
MARVEVRSRARADLERLARFLWEKGEEEAAARALAKIAAGMELLTFSPRLGKPLGDKTGRRELFITFGAGAYILRYMLKDEDTVVILRVKHSREQRIE